MEESYLAVLEELGGLDVAKPKAMTERLQPLYPHLSLQNVKWHLLAHRRRLERHREMEPAGVAVPTKWTGRQAAACGMGHCGGRARPACRCVDVPVPPPWDPPCGGRCRSVTEPLSTPCRPPTLAG